MTDRRAPCRRLVRDDPWLMVEAKNCGWRYLRCRDAGKWVEYLFLNAKGERREIALAKRRGMA